MIISTRGRYALRVMIDLSQQDPDSYTPLKEIAARQEISEKYLENILKSLVTQGFILGLRGKGECAASVYMVQSSFFRAAAHSKWVFTAAKDFSLMTCSMRQASSAAVFSSTPSSINNCVRTVCRVYML